jgi:hypothetical protein
MKFPAFGVFRDIPRSLCRPNCFRASNGGPRWIIRRRYRSPGFPGRSSPHVSGGVTEEPSKCAMERRVFGKTNLERDVADP